MRGEGKGKGLESGHQAGGNAQSDQAATKREFEEVLTEGENAGPGRSDQQQPRFDAPRSEAVEEHAEWQLRRREGEKVRTRQQTESTRAESHFACQQRPDDGIDCPIEVGKKVGAGERQEEFPPEHDLPIP